MWQDSVANVHGRLRGSNESLPELVIGSHYDTVLDAGRYVQNLYLSFLGFLSKIKLFFFNFVLLCFSGKNLFLLQAKNLFICFFFPLLWKYVSCVSVL